MWFYIISSVGGMNGRSSEIVEFSPTLCMIDERDVSLRQIQATLNYKCYIRGRGVVLVCNIPKGRNCVLKLQSYETVLQYFNIIQFKLKLKKTTTYFSV